MSKLKKRSRSLDYSIYNSKGSWFRFLFGGFRTNRRSSKRDRSEKSTYSQTEIYNPTCKNETGTQYSSGKSKGSRNCPGSSQNISSDISRTPPSTTDIKDIGKSSYDTYRLTRMSRCAQRNLILNLQGIGGILNDISEDLVRECCFVNIKYETQCIRSVIILQRLKFKHELSKLYHKIYTKEDQGKNGYSFYKEILIDDQNIFRNLSNTRKMKAQCKSLKSAISANEQEIKKLCCTGRSNLAKRYTIKKCQSVKDKYQKIKKLSKKIETNSDIKKEIDPISTMDVQSLSQHKEGERRSPDDLFTGSVIVSVSSNDIPLMSEQNLAASYDTIKTKSAGMSEQSGGDSNHIFFVDETEGSASIRKECNASIFSRGDQNEPNNDKEKLEERHKKANQFFDGVKMKCPALKERGNRKLHRRESSVVLDIEVIEPPEGSRRASGNRNKKVTASRPLDVKPNSPKEDVFNAPILISIPWTKAPNVSSTLSKTSNQISQNNQNSNFSTTAINIRNYTNICSGYVERICDNYKSVSTKYSYIGDHCVTFSESRSRPYGTFCEVLSDDLSNDTEPSFVTKHKSQFDILQKSERSKVHPTFWNHTISSKLKMKNEV